VDVSLRLLTLTARAGARSKERTIALAAFVSVHPTSLGNVTEVYSGDFFGVAALEVEHRLSERGQPPPVVAIFNGPEGDVSPQWHAQDRRDTLRLGRLLGEALARVSGHGERVDGPILRRGVQLSLSGRCARDDDGRERCAAVKPAAGLTTLGGAEDGRPQPYYLGCVEGLTRADGGSNDGHGVKLTEVDGRCRIPFWLPIPSSRLVTAILPPPSQIPLLVFRFGSLVFATLPGEFTTMLGERIRSALRKSGPAARDHVLIGLANEYLSYFTTPEEYDLQHYEGSSMLYGREAGAVVAAELGALAASVDSEASKGSPGRSYRYAVGGAREFGVLASRSAYDRPLAEALRNLLLDLETGLPLAPPRYCWTESPEHVTVHGAVPGAMIEVRAGSDFKPLMINGRTEDDSGTGFVIAVDRIDGNGVSYCALWLAPRGFSAAEVRFRIRDARGRARCSEPFAVSQGRRLEGASREIEDERPGNECRA
jgi:neutral ceramidase